MDMRALTDRKVLLIVGGGIAAYKALELVRLIAKAGGETRVILTEAGAKFVTPLSLAALSGHFYVTGEYAAVVARRGPAARFAERPELWTPRAQKSHMNYNYELDAQAVYSLVLKTLPHVRSHELSPHRRHAGRQRHLEL